MTRWAGGREPTLSLPLAFAASWSAAICFRVVAVPSLISISLGTFGAAAVGLTR